MDYINDLIVKENITVLEAMEQLDQTAKRILFIAPKGKLEGVVTDGDIRRHLIRNGSLNEPLNKIATFKPKFLTYDSKSQAKFIMKKYSIKAIPLVDERGILKSVIFDDDIELVRETHLDIPVVINAGGFGTRLHPYTKVLPKPLIPIGDKPILSLIIKSFEKYGCKDYYVIVNHKKELIKAYYSDQKEKINFIDEYIPLGTGGGLSLLKGVFSGTIFFSNCDILIDTDFSSIYNYHRKEKNIITMVCAIKNVEIPYGVVNMTQEGIIDSFSEKPQYSFLTNTGLYILNTEVIDELKDNQPISFPEIIESYRKKGSKIGVYPINEKSWLDMGQLEELELMRQRLGV